MEKNVDDIGQLSGSEEEKPIIQVSRDHGVLILDKWTNISRKDVLALHQTRRSQSSGRGRRHSSTGSRSRSKVF